MATGVLLPGRMTCIDAVDARKASTASTSRQTVIPTRWAEVRAKAGDSAFSVVVETAKQVLAKVDELIELAHVEDVSVPDWSGKIMDLGTLEAEAAEA